MNQIKENKTIEEINVRRVLAIGSAIKEMVRDCCFVEWVEGVNKYEVFDRVYGMGVASEPLRVLAEYIDNKVQSEKEQYLREFVEYVNNYKGINATLRYLLERFISQKGKHGRNI